MTIAGFDCVATVVLKTALVLVFGEGLLGSSCCLGGVMTSMAGRGCVEMCGYVGEVESNFNS